MSQNAAARGGEGRGRGSSCPLTNQEAAVETVHHKTSFLLNVCLLCSGVVGVTLPSDGQEGAGPEDTRTTANNTAVAVSAPTGRLLATASPLLPGCFPAASWTLEPAGNLELLLSFTLEGLLPT